MQAADPEPEEEPGLQSLQANAPLPLYLPTEQGVGTPAPFMQYEPAVHATQERLPVPGANRPTAQRAQEEAPGMHKRPECASGRAQVFKRRIKNRNSNMSQCGLNLPEA